MKVNDFNETMGTNFNSENGVILPFPQYSTIDEGFWSPYYCDDCETYHSIWVGHEYRAEDGIVWVDWITVDTDGDSDCFDSYVYDEETHDKNYKKYLAESETEQQEYYNHVAETGDDCLNEFLIPRTFKKTRNIDVAFTRTDDGKAQLSTVKENNEFITGNLDATLKRYLYLDDSECYIGTWGELCDAVEKSSNEDTLKITVSFEETIARDKETVKSELQAAAREALKK